MVGCVHVARHTNEIDPEFYEARAILFSKMGQHRQALEIYVFKLGDYTKAEEYASSSLSFNVLIQGQIL